MTLAGSSTGAMTHKIEGKGTWWFPILNKLPELGIKSRVIESFDYQKFYDQGESYVSSVYKPETGDWYIKNSNLAASQALGAGFYKKCQNRKMSSKVIRLRQLAEKWLAGGLGY